MENQNFLISIILPVYNGEKFLPQAIESCLNQTYPNIEVIIVDDASNDSSLQIAESFLKLDDRVKVITNRENKKLPASLNVGHQASAGSFLTWTSDDNFYEPEALEVMLTELLKSKADIVYSNFNIIEENGEFRREFEFDNHSSLLLGNTVGACFLYEKEVFVRNGGYDESLHTVEDYDFWLQASLHSTFYHISKTLYNFRSHKNSLSFEFQRKDSNLRAIFQEGLNQSYEKFFASFKSLKHKEYARLFTKFHQYDNIDVSSFLENYRQFQTDMQFLCDRVQILNLDHLIYGVDLKLRASIHPFKSNQNFKTLKNIFVYRPMILLNYDRRRGIKIVLKCLKF